MLLIPYKTQSQSLIHFKIILFVEFLLLSVYADGRVCISILHAPGDDPMGYETSAERWSPVQSVEKILLSVVSMLAGKLLGILAIKCHLSC